VSRVIRRLAARQDLVETAYYYISQGNPATAERFREQAESLFARLADMPGLGARYDPDHPALTELRFLPMRRFKKHLMFYRPIPDGIKVIRVLHGAREIECLLAAEFGIADDDAEDGALSDQPKHNITSMMTKPYNITAVRNAEHMVTITALQVACELRSGSLENHLAA
jgi:toxin ParE1/3/4